MSKKNKKSNTASQASFDRPRYSVDPPDVVDMDTLACSSDEDLFNRNYHLSSAREDVLRSGTDAIPWEVELAYVHRELMLRATRRNMHERYVKMNPEDVLPDLENDLDLEESNQ